MDKVKKVKTTEATISTIFAKFRAVFILKNHFKNSKKQHFNN